PAPGARFRSGLMGPVNPIPISHRLHRAVTALNSGCLEGKLEMLRMDTKHITRIAATLALSLGIALFTGCAALQSGTSNSNSSSAVTVSPATGNVRAGDTLQFSAKISGTISQTVVWSVNGLAGGSASTGTISSSGMYTAPAALPNPNSVSIEATSSSDKTLSDKVMITLENPVPTVTAVSPAAVPVGNFTLTITG